MSSELERCLSDPGYTPPVAALPEILGRLHELGEDDAQVVERVVARAGAAAGGAALRLLPDAAVLQRRRLLSLVKRLCAHGGSELYLDALLRALTDSDANCRRTAIRALGSLADPRAEPALVAALARERAPEQRAIVEALGKLGAELASGTLAALSSADPELARRAAQARVLIERRRGRRAPSALDLERRLERPARVALLCRSGLSALLGDELRALSPRVVSPGRVDVEYAGALGGLLEARIALELAVVVPLGTPERDPVEQVAAALRSPNTESVLRAWTSGTPRFRLAWPEGHQRATTWKIAERVSSETLVNDSREATWTARVVPSTGELHLVPRLQPDRRFAYRVADVPGASHPTVAAALARYAEARADDVIWDPFVGSGLELVERSLFGAYDRLVGSDIDPKALEAARRNLASANVARAELTRGDARSFAPGGVRSIITNPPMGRRVLRDGTLGALLEEFIAHAARVLPRGGRLVWLSPDDRRTDELVRAAGLRVHSGPEVDLGGFTARLQRCERP